MEGVGGAATAGDVVVVVMANVDGVARVVAVVLVAGVLVVAVLLVAAPTLDVVGGAVGRGVDAGDRAAATVGGDGGWGLGGANRRIKSDSATNPMATADAPYRRSLRGLRRRRGSPCP